MKKTLFFTLWFLCQCAWPPVLHACSPCPKVLNFEDTVAAADLIIVGRKIGEYPPTDFDPRVKGPNWIRVDVLEVLKGDTDLTAVKVNSYDGMCPYGIVIKDEDRYVIFLKKARTQEVDYDAVNSGCGVKMLPVNDGGVEYEGETMSMGIFKLMLQETINSAETHDAVPARP